MRIGYDHATIALPPPTQRKPRARARRVTSTGEGSAPATAPSAIDIRREQATKASVGPIPRARDSAHDSAEAARPRRRPRAISAPATAPARDKHERMHAPPGHTAGPRRRARSRSDHPRLRRRLVSEAARRAARAATCDEVVHLSRTATVPGGGGGPSRADPLPNTYGVNRVSRPAEAPRQRALDGAHARYCCALAMAHRPDHDCIMITS